MYVSKFQLASKMLLFSAFIIPVIKSTWQTYAGIQRVKHVWLEMDFITKKKPTEN